MYVPHPLYPFICRWVSRLLPCSSYCKQCYNELGYIRLFQPWLLQGICLGVELQGHINGKPLQCSCLENPRDWGAWWAAIYGVAQSWTWLKQLSSSSSSSMVILFLVFNGISILSSTVAVSIYILTNRARAFPFLHTVSSIYCL